MFAFSHLYEEYNVQFDKTSLVLVVWKSFFRISTNIHEIVRGYLWTTFWHDSDSRKRDCVTNVCGWAKRHCFCRLFPKTNHVIRCSYLVLDFFTSCQHFVEYFSEAKALSII